MAIRTARGPRRRECGPVPAAQGAPTSARGQLTIFDRFATRVHQWASGGWFFAFCVALVVVWLPTIWVLPSVDTWQLVINTATTIVTFLLVALLQNTQSRSSKATHEKLNAIAAALGAVISVLAAEHEELLAHAQDLAAANGLEHRVGSIAQ